MCMTIQVLDCSHLLNHIIYHFIFPIADMFQTALIKLWEEFLECRPEVSYFKKFLDKIFTFY